MWGSLNITEEYLNELIKTNKEYIVLTGYDSYWSHDCMNLDSIFNYMFDNKYELLYLPDNKLGILRGVVFKKLV
jgi:hypothetical protein